jgi:hypothetical protein
VNVACRQYRHCDSGETLFAATSNKHPSSFPTVNPHCMKGLAMQTNWVLIDNSKGAKCADGTSLSAGALAHIAEAVMAQMNNEFADEYGGTVQIRVAANGKDVRPGELAYSFEATLPDAPGASAYHDDNGGEPAAYCAVTTCANLLGANGVGVDASHEIAEAQGDPGCNRLLDDTQGQVHADEKCDAVEVQSYAKTCADGTQVQVSNFLLQAWGVPGATGPYDYMTQAKLPGAVAPSGPMATANGDGGNYQIVAPFSTGSETQVTAKRAEVAHLVGKRRKGTPHWTSRAGFLLGVKYSNKLQRRPSHRR